MALDFLTMLADGVVLFDGAMGTMLYERGIFINRCFDEINLSNPSLVGDIHRDYIEAGADVIETNTFGANRFKLRAHSLDDRLYDINRAGAEIAKRIAGDDTLVAGSIGPLGIKIEPWGPTSNEEAVDVFSEQARALLDGGVDLFVLETFADLNEIHQAIHGVRRVSDRPIMAQMTLQRDGLGLYGTEPGEFAVRLSQWGVEVVGVNCSVGPKTMLEALEKMVKAVSCYISAQPNAGIPQNVEGRNMYMVSPEYFAEYARRFVQVGASVVGGCCGTTPAHIRSMRDAIRTIHPSPKPYTQKAPRVSTEREMEPVPMREKSRLASRIASGEFVTLVEIVPPRGCDPQAVLESADRLSKAAVDAINIPDSPRATSRMSPLSLAVLIEQRAGIETVLHYCCRDRNILGMQSDLLGAHALGLRNVLIITGDPIKTGDYPDATAVFDIDSIGLTNVVHELNRGSDIGGRRLTMPTSFLIGVGVNPGAVNFDEEMHRFYWKVDAGAEFAVTQPVFDTVQFERFLERIEPDRIPVIAGIWPLVSFKNAEFMNNELPGVSVPDRIMKRMRDAGSGESAMREGVSIAVEILRALRPHIDGVQISAPFNRHELALDVIRRGLAP
ncbi:MAG TPA: bifunctional homocysteine S-methyltransferase/methylenetetrahydrofolate reductase [Patescibacteria group bacterium]|nr:bifunctional homocysteine S-methyltransferase/methylenetetrahydrofolate reductase [Patescibacteria group bacterium]